MSTFNGRALGRGTSGTLHRFFIVILFVLLSSVFAFGADVGPTVEDLLKRLETASPRELPPILQGLEASINRTDPAHLAAVEKRVIEIGRQKGINGEQYASEIFERIDKVQWDQVDEILDRVADKYKDKLQAIVRTGSSGQRHLERRLGSLEVWEKPYKYLFSDDDISFVGEAAEDAMKEFEILLKQAGLKGRAKVKGFVLSSITETTNYELILKQLRDAEAFVGSGFGLIKKEMLEKGGAVVYASEGGTLKTATQKIVDYVKTHSDSILAEVLNLGKIKAELKEFGPMTLFASVERVLAEGNLQEREVIKQLWRVHVAMDLAGAYKESAGMLGAGGFSTEQMKRIGQILTETVMGKRDIGYLKSLLATAGLTIEDLRKRYFKLTLLNTSSKLWQIIDRIEKRCLASGEDVAQAIANSAEVRRFVHELAAGFDLLVKSKTYKLFSPEEFTELLRSANPESRNLFRVLWDAYFETQQLLTIERTAIKYAEAGNPKKIIENLSKTTDPKARAQVVEAAVARTEGTKQGPAIQEIRKMVQTPQGNKYLTMALAKDVGKKLMIAGIVTGAAVMIKNQFDSWLAGKQVDLSDSAQSLIEIIPFTRGIWRIAVTEDIDKVTVFEFVKDALYLTPLWWVALGADGVIIATEVGGAVGGAHAQDIEQGLVDILVYNGDFEQQGSRYFLRGISLPSNQVSGLTNLVVGREDLEKFYFETRSVTVRISTPGKALIINNLSEKSNEVLAKVYVANDTTITAIHDATRKHLNEANWAQLKDDIGEGKTWLLSNDFLNWLLGIDILVERSQEKWAQVYRSIKGQVDKRAMDLRTKYLIPNLIEAAEAKKQALEAQNDLYPKLQELQREIEKFRSDGKLEVSLSEEVKKRSSEKGSENARADNETKRVTGGEYWQAAFKSYTWALRAMKQIQGAFSEKVGCANFNQGHFEWSGDYEQDVLRETHSRAGYASDLSRIIGDVAKIKGSPGDLQDPTDRQAYGILCDTVLPWRVALDSTNKAVKGETFPENYHPDHQKGAKFYDDYAKALDRVRELYKKDTDFQKLLEAGAEIRRGGNTIILGRGMPLELVLKSDRLRKDYREGRLTFQWISDPAGTFRPDAKNLSSSFSPHIPLPATVWISVEKFGDKGEKLKGSLSIQFEVKVPEDFLMLTVDNAAIARGGFGKAEARVPDRFIAGPVKFSYLWSCNNCTLDRRAQEGYSTVGVQGPRDGSGRVTVTLSAEDKAGRATVIASKSAVVPTAGRFTARLDVYATPETPQKGDYLMFKALAVPTSSAPRPESLRIDWYQGNKHLIQGDVYSFRAGSSGRYTLTAILSFHDGKEQVILDRKTAAVDVKEKTIDSKQKPLDEEDDVISAADTSVKDDKVPDDKGVKKDPPGCSYEYTEWGECSRATKKQTRSVVASRPEGCVEKTPPALEQGCTPPPSEEDKRNAYLNCLCRCYCGWAGHIGVWYDPEQKTKPECKSDGPCIGGIGAWGCSSRHFFGPPNDCAKGCYEGAYGKGSYDEKIADKIRRDENKKFKKPLKITLKADKNPADFGDIVNLTAAATDGTGGYKWNWGGCAQDAKDANAKVVNTRDCTSCTASVTVTDQDGESASDSVTIKCNTLRVKLTKESPKENVVPVGGKATFFAEVFSGDKPAAGTFYYIWERNPDAIFGDPKNPTYETKGGATYRHTATFRKAGTTPVWVSVLKEVEGRKATVGESEQIPIEVGNPELAITFTPQNPYIGQEVKLQVTSKPKIGDDIIGYWWEIPGYWTGTGDKASFKPKDSKPVKVIVHAKTKDGGDEVGTKEVTITAQGYQVAISEPRYLESPPQIWQCDTQLGQAQKCGMVTVKPNQFAVFRDLFMKTTVSPSPESPRYRWSVDPSGSCGFPGAGNEIKLNCSNTGTYAVKVEVTNAEGAKLGEATQSVTVSISQETLDNSKKAKEAYEKLQKAKELVAQGKLDEGIPLAEEASRLDPKNGEAKNLSDKWKKDREEIKQHIAKLDQFLKDVKITDADGEFQAASRLHPKYQLVVDAEKRLKEAKDKANKLKKEIAEKLQKSKELVAQGRLDEGISLAEEAVKLDPKNTEAPALLNKWKNEKQTVLGQIGKVKDLVSRNRFDEAERELAVAKNLHARYLPLIETEKLLKDKRDQYAKEIAAKLNKAKELVQQGKLDEATSIAEEVLKADPRNQEASNLLNQIKGQKQKVEAARQLAKEGDAFDRQGKPGEALRKYQEAQRIYSDKDVAEKIKQLESRQAQAKRLRGEGESLQNQKKLQEAIAKFRESLKPWPDPALEEHIRRLEAQVASDNENKARAEKLWNEGKNLFDQNKPSEALSKFKESLKYWPDGERQNYVSQLEAGISQKKAQSQRLRGEGEALQNQGKVKEAVGKYQESQKYWPDPALENRIAALESEMKKQQETQQKKECAQRNQTEGAGLQQQGRLPEALAKYKESLACWPNPEMERHISLVEAEIKKQEERVGKKATADRLWQEGADRFNSKQMNEAMAKFKESLTYWSDPTRADYVRKLEAEKAAGQKLKDEGAALQNQGKLQEAVNKYKESLSHWPDPALEAHATRVSTEIKKQEAQPGIQTPTAGSGGVEGTWEGSFNNYLGKMELKRMGNTWTGRIWFDVYQRWEQLTNIAFYSTTGRLEFTRPIPGATQRHSGVLSGERLEGTFTQENSSGKYAWWAKRTQGIMSTQGTTSTQGPTTTQGASALSPYYHVDLTPYGGKKGASRKVKEIEVEDGSWVRLKATHEKRLVLDINLPQPVTSSAIAVVSNLDNAHHVPDGFITTVLTVRTTSGERRFEFKAGVHSSEWNRGETGGADHKWPKETNIGGSRWMAVFQLPQGSVVTGMRFDHKDTDKKYYHGDAAPGFCLRGITLITSGTVGTQTPSGTMMTPTQGTIKPVPPPVAIQNAQLINLVGKYKLTDPARSFAKYHGDTVLQRNGQGLVREYRDGSLIKPKYPETMNKDGYLPVRWHFDPDRKKFLFDWTLEGKLKDLGAFEGTVSGNTNSFTLSGHWSNGTSGQLQFERVE